MVICLVLYLFPTGWEVWRVSETPWGPTRAQQRRLQDFHEWSDSEVLQKWPDNNRSTEAVFDAAEEPGTCCWSTLYLVRVDSELLDRRRHTLTVIRVVSRLLSSSRRFTPRQMMRMVWMMLRIVCFTTIRPSSFITCGSSQRPSA